MRCTVSAIAWLAACAEPAPVLVPLDSPVSFKVHTFLAEPAERPLRARSPQVFIDGVATSSSTFDYDTNAEALEAVHTVELRDGGLILATRSVRVERCSEPPAPFTPPVTEYSATFCIYDSGDLRFGSFTVRTTSGTCVGDGFCLPACSATGCGTGEHCTSRAPSTDPFYSRLACAPIGSRGRGEACVLIADPGGAYDDCGEGLLCVEGMCRATCRGGCTGSETCVYVEGQPPELQICR